MITFVVIRALRLKGIASSTIFLFITVTIVVLATVLGATIIRCNIRFDNYWILNFSRPKLFAYRGLTLKNPFSNLAFEGQIWAWFFRLHLVITAPCLLLTKIPSTIFEMILHLEKRVKSPNDIINPNKSKKVTRKVHGWAQLNKFTPRLSGGTRKLQRL